MTICLQIATADDVDQARREAVQLARRHGFEKADADRISLATVELARNLVRYAYGGEIVLSVHRESNRHDAIQVESRDRGPGIGDLEQALVEGFSSGGGLGAGLSTVRRAMDEFTLTSSPDGTRVLARKWPTQAR